MRASEVLGAHHLQMAPMSSLSFARCPKGGGGNTKVIFVVHVACLSMSPVTLEHEESRNFKARLKHVL